VVDGTADPGAILDQRFGPGTENHHLRTTNDAFEVLQRGRESDSQHPAWVNLPWEESLEERHDLHILDRAGRFPHVIYQASKTLPPVVQLNQRIGQEKGQMKMEFLIAVAVIAAGLLVYLTWRVTDVGTNLNTNASQVTAPQSTQTTNPPENAQPSQQK